LQVADNDMPRLTKLPRRIARYCPLAKEKAKRRVSEYYDILLIFLVYR
jgi:hypothetical protein